jgi:protein tyrosine/serine phosphatase
LFRQPYDGLRHFGAVEEGVLYRCGQPRPEELAELIDRWRLRTVVSLRGTRESDDPDAWEKAEADECRARGVEFVPLPCNHRNPPTDEQVEEFIRLTQTAERRPVLVHCRLGQQRTLLFCALYRVRVQGMSPEAALREMDALGFGVGVRRHRALLEAFVRLARGGADGEPIVDPV